MSTMTERGDDKPVRSRRSRRPSSDERALWRLATRDTAPLAGRDVTIDPVPVIPEPPVQPPAIPAPPVKPSANKASPKPLVLQPLATRRGAPVAGLDRRTSERLRKGQLPIEARIDLHGMTQERARTALDQFIGSSWDRGLRAVLVITGKGVGGKDVDPWSQPRAGVLRANVPRWLHEQPNGPRILAFSEAQPQDGGGGALYVLLRRRREAT